MEHVSGFLMVTGAAAWCFSCLVVDIVTMLVIETLVFVSISLKRAARDLKTVVLIYGAIHPVFR